MNKNIQKYIVENMSTIMKLIIVYLLGILIGIVLFNFTDIRSDYTNIVKNIFDATKQENFQGINIIVNGMKNNIVFIVLIYSTILTIIAPILITLFFIIKAIITGIYISTIFCIFGIGNGVIALILSVIIPLLISLPGYIIICTNVLNIFSSIKVQEKIDFKYIVRQIYWLVISVSLISFSLVIEQLMTGVVLNIYSGI